MSSTGRRDHAVVIGASMAGLLAARVLSDNYRKVTVIERDTLPTHWANRPGVPQGRHVHTLLSRGCQTVERLFPGISAELQEGGAPVFGDLSEIRFEVSGHLLSREPHAGERLVQASRPFLEGRVRARVAQLPNVTLRDSCTVIGPMHTEDRTRVTGVHLAGEEGTEALAADLVVDASGRGARTPAWLEQLGYARPPEDELKVKVSYVSQQVRLPSGHGVERLVLHTLRPGRPVGFGLFAYENDTWTLTVIGLGDAAPAVDREAALAAIRPFADADVYDALAASIALSEPVAYRYPATRRRRYEKLRHFPDGLLVTGDAVCSFNPVYGQGMTVAAIEADALEAALSGPDAGLSRRFFKSIAKPVDAAWQLATGADLALPEIEAPRTRQVRMVNAWVERVLTAAETDADVAEAFVRVSGLVDPPYALFRPRLVASVLRQGRRRGGRRPAGVSGPVVRT